MERGCVGSLFFVFFLMLFFSFLSPLILFAYVETESIAVLSSLTSKPRSSCLSLLNPGRSNTHGHSQLKLVFSWCEVLDSHFY